MRRVIKRLILPVALLFMIGAGASACMEDDSSQAKETNRQQSNYDRLTANQPAKSMQYSPTRDTINFWIDTWGKDPNKLSYVYLQASNGQLAGYFVFKGLPVSYCASLTPNYRIHGDANGGNVLTPAPAMDGVFYGGQGSCQTYYGRDATTDSYLEYTVGTGISALIYEQPLARQDVEPLGITKIEDVK